MKSIYYLTIVFAFFCYNKMWSQENVIHVKTLTKNFYGNGSVAVGLDGTVFVNEYGTANPDISGSGTRIFSVTEKGEVAIVSEKVSGAVGNALDSEGNYYFNNGNSYTSSDFMVLKDGKITKIATLEGFSGDILIDGANDFFYITSYTHPAIRRVSKQGQVEDYAKDERLKGATGITFGPDKDMFVSNFTTGKIFKLDPKGSIEELASIPIVYPGYVIGYITYFEENLYATGYGSNKIYKIGMDGEVTEFAGSGEYKMEDGTATKASFVTPNGIDIDTKNRRLYISQNGNGKPASLRYIDLPKK
ncbi:hypothetical protein KIM67_17300 [Flagellimonas sp. 389]|uniref:hypothetical protein n=1 Tax=Flagellimonas sp. 389 TaxID=2835862 RepID=UPI001BD644B3|nr:hypothetical protein [Flagellimonas sp. 389]MBS9464183.1 hypothetical protein [Flagellimonas sp. 389]